MALNIISNVQLDMKAPNTVIVYANQYDSAGSVRAQLLNSGESWAVPAGAKAVVMFKKSDNIGGFYDVTEFGVAAVEIDSDRSIIYINYDPQVLTTAGRVAVQINFYQNDQRLSSFAFYTDVQASAVTSGEIASSWLFNILSQEIAQTLTVATTPQAMTDWLEANITQETGYVIDNTLTVAGAASDAQATGKMVTVSNLNPNTVANKVWVKKTPAEIQIPTCEEVNDLKSAFDSITEQTENIQNKSTGFYSYNDNTGIIGPTTATTSYGMSDYIPCNGDTAYTITQYDFTPSIKPRVMFLDASDTVVGYMTGTTPGSSVFTSPATAVKMTCWFYAGAGVVLGDNPRIQILEGSFTNPEYIKPVTAEDIFARKAINDLEEKVDALDYLSDSDIYTEIGADVFDPAKAITGYDISDTSPYFSAAANCVITPPINVEGQSNVTIRSANYSRYRRWIVFSTSQELDGQYVVGVSNQFRANLTSTLTDYVIDVPAGAKYMFAALKRNNGGDGWVNDTIAYGKEGTSDPYSEFFAGMYSHDHESLFKVKPPSILDSYLSAKVTEDFTPYTTGASNRLTSRDIYDRCNLLFFTDNHVNEDNASLQNVKDAIDFINNAKFHVDALVNAGDAFDYYGEKATAKAVFKQFADAAQNSKYPVLFAKGNHDLNDWANPPAKAFDDADWSEIWFDYAETEWGIVRQTKANGNKSTWNYFDIPSQKVRIVCVDCQDTDKSKTNSSGNVLYSGANSFYISNEQMNWIASTALNFDDKDDKGWGVIIVMHQYERYSTSNTPAYESAIQKLHDLCVAFNTQSTYSNSYTFATDEWFNLDITADFTRYATATNKPHMICFLFGHEHYDNNDVKDGINRIWTANQSCASAYADNRVNRIAGTTTQNLFDLISIDTKTRKIRFVRFGAGKNCFGVGGNRFIPDGLSY